MSATSDGSFLDLIDLASGDSPRSFVGSSAPEEGGRTYGGQLLAQAVVAAGRTVGPDRRIHSLHAYFLRAGDVDLATEWQVEIMRDGRSFASRAVTGTQAGTEVFHMITSFHTLEDGYVYRTPADVAISPLPPPEAVETTYVSFSQAQEGFDPTGWFGHQRPMEVRYINPPAPGSVVTEPQLTWTRIVGDLPDDPLVHDAGIAYLADATLVDHVVLPQGKRWHDPRLTGASLDHAMWFNHDSRADAWLLYDQRIESTGGARGLATGRLYSDDGLVATCAQEGLIRWGY